MAGAVTKILIVDADTKEAQRLAALVSGAPGARHEPVYAGSIDSAGKLIAGGGSDVVFIDIGIQGGWASIIPSAGNTPIVVTCRAEQEEAALKAVDEGAHDYIVKERASGFQISKVIKQCLEHRKMQSALSDNALSDPLTGLPSQALLLDRIAGAIEVKKQRPDYLFALVFVEIEKFASISNTQGKAAAEGIVVETAKRLKKCCDPADTVARLKDNTFAILKQRLADAMDTKAVSRAVRDAMDPPFNVSGKEIFVTVNIGMTTSTRNYEKPEDILRDADIALARVKEQGGSAEGGEAEVFTTMMFTTEVRRLQVENDLRKAIERKEFVVFYQPIVSLATGKIAGCEALVRWKHPETGMVPPGDFIPVAEDTSLIVPIGEQVLRMACRQNRQWRDLGFRNIVTAVNISAKQFQHQGLVDLIKSVVKEHGIEFENLKAEVTESTAMKDFSTTIKILNDLSELGIQVSIDDFGSGYCSLAYLKKFPLDTLKIDRAFIKDIPRDPNDMAISSAIIAMAHSLELRVIAEGVETQEQLSFLKSHHCDEIQGFIFSKPVPGEEFTKLLQNKTRLSLPQQSAHQA